jgi:hypothetical protein
MCKQKRKLFTVSDKVNNLVKDDAHTITYVELASHLELPVSTLNIL